MTERDEATPLDEAQPNPRGETKQRRKRRKVYTKRTELLLDEELEGLLDGAKKLATQRLGRPVTMGAIARESLRDGCQAILRELRRAPGGEATEDRLAQERVEALIEVIGQLRLDLSRQGNNVNQIAKVAHSTGQVVDGLAGTQAAIERVDDRLVAILGELISVRTDDEDDEG